MEEGNGRGDFPVLSLSSWRMLNFTYEGQLKHREKTHCLPELKNVGRNSGQSKLLDKKQRARDRESHILCLNSAPTAGWPLNHARSAQSVSSSAEDIRPEVGFEMPPRDRLFAVWIRHQDYGRVNLQWFFSCENGTHFTGSLYGEPLWILNIEHCECYQESRK